MKYNKTHPLWIVEKFQNDLVCNGGIINEKTNLLAYFENKCLYPENGSLAILSNLVWQNCMFNDKFKTESNMISVERVTYWQSIVSENNKFSGYINLIEYKSHFMPGYSSSIPENLKHLEERSLKGYVFNDNNIIYKKPTPNSRPCFAYVISKKYIDMIRLVMNNFDLIEYEKINKNKNLYPAIIIAAGMIIGSIIYAFSQRYEFNGSGARFDKWTRKAEYPIIVPQKK